MQQIAVEARWTWSGCPTRRLRWLALLPLLLMLGACVTAPDDSALEAAASRVAEAEARAAAEAARADQANQRALEAQALAEGVERRARDALDNQSALQQSLAAARQRATAAESDAATAGRLAEQARRELEAARAELAILAQRPAPEAVVPRDDFEEAQARLAEAEAELAAVTTDPGPVYDVSFRGSTEMVLDEQIAISVEVSVPSGEPVPGDEVFRSRVKAVTRAVRASLSGSNFEISYDENLIQSMDAGTAVWNFRVKPLVVGKQTLYATVTQYAEDGTGFPTALRSDSWDVNVVVDPAPQIIAAVSRNLGEFTIGILMFFGGMIAEFIRRRVFGAAGKDGG
jgi:multidrug efflux pump subunit AcrA (membrane-fusion protein)